MELKWILKHIGPSTLFITLSNAEWFSDHLKTVNGTVPGIDEMIHIDLVNVSIHFHMKWEAVFMKLIRSKERPVFGQSILTNRVRG